MVEALESILLDIEGILNHELQEQHYNTIGNFLSFYSDFKKSKEHSFQYYYSNYQPKIVSNGLSCVGLSMALRKHILASDLSVAHPDLENQLFLASCEEWTEVSNDIPEFSQPLNYSKDHVLLALQISVDGRRGVVLLDPGYHVGFPVVVMADGCYPHTGWFVQSNTNKSKREYGYTLHDNGQYVKWLIRETRNGKESMCHNLIYIGQNFNNPVEIVEKKNLVYNFRTLVIRDGKTVVAGIYCNFESDEKFTVFYNDSTNTRNECKIPFSYFKGKEVNNEVETAIEYLAMQSKFSNLAVETILRNVVEAYEDPTFMPFMKEVNSILEE